MRSKRKSGSSQVTIRDVAKAAGASVSTVSAALNQSDYVSESTRNKIEEAIKQLNYRPNALARGLRLRKTHSIAIVVPDLSNSFYVELVRGAEDYSASVKYTLLIGDSRESWEDERSYLDSFERRRVDGVIRVPALSAPRKRTAAVTGDIPVVYADRFPPLPEPRIARVGVDNVRAAESAIRYLISLGHRRIGVIVGDASSGTSTDRLRGYMQELQRANIRSDRTLIHEGHNDVESGHSHAMQLLTHPNRPTAIFCTNNLMAMGAFAAIQELELLCPEDISLVGFDDFYWATMLRPKMTVVSQPAREIGMMAARMLIDEIEGRQSIASPMLLGTKLIVRDSCCPPRFAEVSTARVGSQKNNSSNGRKRAVSSQTS